jgi:hypothetical protein
MASQFNNVKSTCAQIPHREFAGTAYSAMEYAFSADYGRGMNEVLLHDRIGDRNILLPLLMDLGPYLVTQ